MRLRNQAPEQLATFLAFHQQAAEELRGDEIGRVDEEVLGNGRCCVAMGGAWEWGS